MDSFCKGTIIVTLISGLLFAVVNGAAIAQEKSPAVENQEIKPLAKTSGQMLITEITLNGVKKGEFVVFSTANGDWLLREDDLKAMAVSPPYGTPVTIDNEVFYSLRAMSATAIQFDEKKLTLNVALPTAVLPKKTINFLPTHPKIQLRPRDNSAYLNYFALYSGDNYSGSGGSSETVRFWLEPGVRIGELFFHSESTHSLGNSAYENVRYGTNITYDNRETLQRLIVGDFSAFSGNLGSLKNLGGVSFSKYYRIDPYFIKYPLAGFTGDVSTPVEAQIFLDGMQLGTTKLSPGQFDLENINYYGGLHDVSVVLKDNFGRLRTVAYPFYFTDQNLREGLHEYSYNAGLLRKNLGVDSNQYAGWALSAFHLYGLNDSLTLGARGEAEQERINVGAMGLLRLDRWGVISASYAQARDKAGSGWAGVACYGFQDHGFNSQFELRYQSPRYETANLLNPSSQANVFISHPKLEFNAAIAYTVPEWGNFSVHYGYLGQYRHGNQPDQNSNQHALSLGYSRTLSGSWGIQINVAQIFGALPEKNLFAVLTYNFGNDFNARVFHDQREGTRSDSFQLGNNTPIGEGFGYRVGGSWDGVEQGEMQNFTPSLRYNGPYGTYTADVRIDHGTEGKVGAAYQLGTGGSIATVDNTFIFSRPVTDSFGIVDVGKLKGVRVYQSSQEIGRTDEQGRIFLANLGSYLDNNVAIDDRDIPFEYTIKEKELNVSPPLHSGSIIRFDIKRLHIVQGRLHVKTGAGSRAVEFVDLAVVVNNQAQIFPTGKDGEFYLENLEPGQYHARFDHGEHCEFELTIPDSKEMIIELGDLYVCKFSK